jgi:ABC-type transporter lipoprotein component MlaA
MHSSEGVMWTCVTCFVSRLGEGALRKAGAELARFLINSTMGIGGFLDPATVAGIRSTTRTLRQDAGLLGRPAEYVTREMDDELVDHVRDR